MSKIYRFDKFLYVDAFQKELTYFLAVAETLNVSKAAEELGIQQSGLSRAIHRLESDLGQKLFLRKNNGLILTEPGQQFLVAVRDTKNKWEENFRRLVHDTDHLTGLLKIGMHASFGQNYLPPILARLSQELPQVEFEIHPLRSYQVTRKVIENELDFGIVASPHKQPDLVSKVLGEDHLALFQREGHEPARYLVANPETQSLNTILRKFSHLKKIYIRDYELIAKTATNSRFITLLPHSVAKNYNGLVQIGSKLTRTNICLICLKDKLRLNVYKKIFSEIKDIFILSKL